MMSVSVGGGCWVGRPVIVALSGLVGFESGLALELSLGRSEDATVNATMTSTCSKWPWKRLRGFLEVWIPLYIVGTLRCFSKDNGSTLLTVGGNPVLTVTRSSPGSGNGREREATGSNVLETLIIEEGGVFNSESTIAVAVRST